MLIIKRNSWFLFLNSFENYLKELCYYNGINYKGLKKVYICNKN